MPSENNTGGLKIAPGLLPPGLPLEPVSAISPSKFKDLKDCALKGVLTSNGVRPLLPKYPAAHLGTVIHHVLERARAGEMRSGTFEELWSSSIDEEETKLKDDWLNSNLLPLSVAAKGFELKKKQCQLMVEQTCELLPVRSATQRPTSERQTEVPFETSDGRVRGRVDLLKPLNGGEMILDFKSAELPEPAEIVDTSVIPEEYVLQMKLYAALYQAERGEWPRGLRLQGINGNHIDVPISPQECLGLLYEAKQLLRRVNCTIRSHAQDYSVSLAHLASPSAEQCKYCEYRPCCTPYWTAREAITESQWPNDVRGVLLDSFALENGKLLLEVSTGAENAKPISIRGVSRGRHPALRYLGEEILLFGLIRDKTTDSYREGPMTTIFVRPANYEFPVKTSVEPN